MSVATRFSAHALLSAFTVSCREAGADLAAAMKDGPEPSMLEGGGNKRDVVLYGALCVKDGITPAHYAARKGHLEALRLLLEAWPQTVTDFQSPLFKHASGF